MPDAAELILTPKELRTTLQHGLAHLRRRDKLRKLLVRSISFPGMQSLDTRWLKATEQAAHDAALASIGEALDRATVLIRLTRVGCGELPAELAAASVERRPAA